MNKHHFLRIKPQKLTTHGPLLYSYCFPSHTLPHAYLFAPSPGNYFEANPGWINSSINICIVFLKNKDIKHLTVILLTHMKIILGLMVQTCKPSSLGGWGRRRIASTKLVQAVEWVQAQAWKLSETLSPNSWLQITAWW